MRKNSLKVAACFMSVTLLFSSCFVGKFALFNSYAKWQTNMTNSKIVNAIVGFIIGPICSAVCFLADTLVLNSIEFWSGSNPISASIGTTKQVMGKDGQYYAVTTLKNGYEVKAPNGEVTNFIHNDADDSWSVEQNGIQQELFRYNADGTIRATVNGKTLDFSLNEQGVYDARMAAGDGYFFAMR